MTPVIQSTMNAASTICRIAYIDLPYVAEPGRVDAVISTVAAISKQSPINAAPCAASKNTSKLLDLLRPIRELKF